MATADSAIPIILRDGSRAWVRRGQPIAVRWGRNGRQRAEVIDPRPDRKGRILVKKYRHRSNRWTYPTRVRCDEILSLQLHLEDQESQTELLPELTAGATDPKPRRRPRSKIVDG